MFELYRNRAYTIFLRLNAGCLFKISAGRRGHLLEEERLIEGACIKKLSSCSDSAVVKS